MGSQEDICLLSAFLSAFVLRGGMGSVEKWLNSTFLICRWDRGPGASPILASERGITWREARARLDARYNTPLIALCAARLVLWHWLQPVSFVLIYFSWRDELHSEIQQLLALAVLLRETLYFLCSLVALLLSPAFLLADIGASWRSGARAEVIAYVLMPEKYLGWYLAESEVARHRFNIYCAIVILLDLCGLMALWSSFSGRSELPAPLAGCYVVTTVSLLVPACWAWSIFFFRHVVQQSGQQARQEDSNPLFEPSLSVVAASPR